MADKIPASLQAIIEYLNGQMRDTEVLGLEINQYLSADGLTTLVPNLIGKTAIADQMKRTGTYEYKQKYDSLNKFLDSVSNEHIKNIYRLLFAYVDRAGLDYALGTAGFSISIGRYWLFFGYGDDAKMEKNRIKTVHRKSGMPDDLWDYYSVEIAKLSFFESTSKQNDNFRWQLTDKTDESQMVMFIAVIDRFVEKVREVFNE